MVVSSDSTAIVSTQVMNAASTTPIHGRRTFAGRVSSGFEFCCVIGILPSRFVSLLRNAHSAHAVSDAAVTMHALNRFARNRARSLDQFVNEIRVAANATILQNCRV